MLDFYRRAALQGGERVLVNGASRTVGSAAVQLARHMGAHVLLVNATLPEMLRAPWVNVTSNFKVIAAPAAERPECLHELVRLAEAGRFLPVIDRSYPFAQMRETHRHVDPGHTRGSVVVRLGDTLA